MYSFIYVCVILYWWDVMNYIKGDASVLYNKKLDILRRIVNSETLVSIDNEITSEMIYHRGTSLSEHAQLFCHGTQTTDDGRICHCLLFCHEVTCPPK